MFQDSFSSAYAWIMMPLVCVMGLVYLLGLSNPRRRLPPGPKRIPVLGNAHQLPSSSQEQTFKSWADEYGDLVYADFFGCRTLIINSPSIARDLLDKRGAIYSSRPRLVTQVELIGWYPNTAFLPYQAAGRRMQRRWIQAAFGEKDAIRKYDSLQLREICTFLSNLMHTPADFTMHITRYTAALILESVYGHRITSLDDEYVTLMDHAMDATNATGPAGSGIADIFPLLKYVPAWMPGADFKRKAMYARELVWRANHLPYNMVRKAVTSGSARPSFVSELIEKAEKAGRLAEDEDYIRYAAGVLYSAGTDTTKTVLRTFFLAMVLYPEVYHKAQAEVDRVVGNSRLPTLEDRPNLPYLDCILKETYRWNPPVPLGIPHYLTEDDEYEGYHVPGDSTVITNLWSMTHDERTYDAPATFRPERFLDATSSDGELEDPRNIVFGHGRRLCPGRLFGDASVFLAIAGVAATLNIDKARDAEGNVITPEARFFSSLISYPEAYDCDIRPRSPAAMSLVAETLASISA
ncbi:cytochrome P450 [Fomitopsis serialis]|uniref:cytochrome P450 n=1 Tax=Fomitopsis serialis TaxID=139415 RepID=UPI002008E0E6|nr:cytochrome P450 [Neoantrodia serialis]KAH9911170.1 cytochrome P450 [Neoantrodia serialis]